MLGEANRLLAVVSYLLYQSSHLTFINKAKISISQKRTQKMSLASLVSRHLCIAINMGYIGY